MLSVVLLYRFFCVDLQLFYINGLWCEVMVVLLILNMEQSNEVNVYDVLKCYYIVFKGLGCKVGEVLVNSEECYVFFDEMFIELDIYFCIEDDLYYFVFFVVGKLIMGICVEYCQVVDQFVMLLCILQCVFGYEEEWNVFWIVLEVYVDVEECDMIFVFILVYIIDVEFEEFGDKMVVCIEQLCGLFLYIFCIKGKVDFLKVIQWLLVLGGFGLGEKNFGLFYD